MVNISLNQQNQIFAPKNTKFKIISFLFPFYPLKVRNITHLMVLLASLIAVRFLTDIFSLPLGPTLRISFNWVPASIIGWLFGPVIGLFTGALVDTLTFFIHGGVWFWLYAIQEPLITMLAGIIGGIYRLRQNKKGYIFDYLFNQIVIITFTVLGIISLINYGTLSIKSQTFDPIGTDVLTTQILTITCLVSFFVISEIILSTFLVKSFKSKKSPKLFLYVSLLSVLLSVLFSFVLGSFAAIEYFKFLNNRNSPNFITYGVYYYLIPRVVKEAFKLPFMILIIVGVLKLSEPNILKIKQLSFNKW